MRGVPPVRGSSNARNRPGDWVTRCSSQGWAGPPGGGHQVAARLCSRSIRSSRSRCLPACWGRTTSPRHPTAVSPGARGWAARGSAVPRESRRCPSDCPAGERPSPCGWRSPEADERPAGIHRARHPQKGPQRLDAPLPRHLQRPRLSALDCRHLQHRHQVVRLVRTAATVAHAEGPRRSRQENPLAIRDQPRLPHLSPSRQPALVATSNRAGENRSPPGPPTPAHPGQASSHKLRKIPQPPPAPGRATPTSIESRSFSSHTTAASHPTLEPPNFPRRTRTPIPHPHALITRRPYHPLAITRGHRSLPSRTRHHPAQPRRPCVLPGARPFFTSPRGAGRGRRVCAPGEGRCPRAAPPRPRPLPGETRRREGARAGKQDRPMRTPSARSRAS